MLNKNEIRKTETEQKIYETAINLFIKQGYKSTTIRQIAKATNVSTSTVFRFFRSKDDILLRFSNKMRYELDTYAKTLPIDLDAKSKIIAVLLEDIRRVHESEVHAKLHLLELIKTGKLYQIITERGVFWNIFTEILNHAKLTGNCHADVNIDILADLIVILFFNTLSIYFFSGSKIDMGQYLVDCINTLLSETGL